MLMPRITEVERIVVRVPFRERVRPWLEVLNGQWGVIEVLRVSTDDPEIVGWGETLLHYTWRTVSDEAIAKVVGSHPLTHVWDQTIGAGLQQALMDIAGKAAGIPGHRLLGLPKVRDACPISWWTTKAPPEVLAADAVDALAEGYLSCKFKGRPYFDVFEQIEAITAVTPSTYTMSIDWNGMLLTAGEAVPVLREVDKYDQVVLYETPIARSASDLAVVRRRVTKPIVEHFWFSDFDALMRADAVDGFVVVGPNPIQQALAGAAFNKPSFLQIVGTGITTAYALQFGAVLESARWPAVTAMNIYQDDLIVDPIPISGGFARVSDAPGLGIKVDEDALARFRIEPPYEVAYPRTILSFHLSGNRTRHYANIYQLLEECGANVPGSRVSVGSVPVQERGARLEVLADDHSAEFAKLHGRASVSPVWDV